MYLLEYCLQTYTEGDVSVVFMVTVETYVCDFFRATALDSVIVCIVGIRSMSHGARFVSYP